MDLERLLAKAHTFLKKVTHFEERHEIYNNLLFQEATQKSAFHPNIRAKIQEDL